MKRFFLFMLLCISVVFFTISCHNKNDTLPEKIVSFNTKDTASVDALFDFYIESGIILPEMLREPAAISTEYLHTYDCLIEGCEIIHDYLQDSLSAYFFMELSCLSGSCGNGIYIIQKIDNQFMILYNECGVIDPDLGDEEFSNGFKVLYYTKESKNYRLYYNGKNFLSELVEIA